jgi:hypothetical protein
MARTLDQIIAELNPTYQPQVQSIQNQMGLIPGQIAQGEAQLGAKKDQAYENILSGARQRGTGVAFGGIPLGEQAKYAATEYMPALANLRTAGTQQATSLQDALNAIQEKKMTLGQNIYQTEQDRDFQAQQNAMNRASQASSAITPTMLSQILAGQNQQNQPAKPYYEYDATKGYNFKDATGTPLTAFQFSQMTQTPFRKLLTDMAAKGDNNAKIALNYVGDDGGFWQAPKSVKGSLEAVGATGNYQTGTQYKTNTGMGTFDRSWATDFLNMINPSSVGR